MLIYLLIVVRKNSQMAKKMIQLIMDAFIRCFIVCHLESIDVINLKVCFALHCSKVIPLPYIHRGTLTLHISVVLSFIVCLVMGKLYFIFSKIQNLGLRIFDFLVGCINKEKNMRFTGSNLWFRYYF